MKRIEAFICGIASLFSCSNISLTNVFKEFPSSYEKSVEKSLQRSWINVGKALKGSIDSYGKESKKSNSK